jgi:hypothetical protein
MACTIFSLSLEPVMKTLENIGFEMMFVGLRCGVRGGCYIGFENSLHSDLLESKKER